MKGPYRRIGRGFVLIIIVLLGACTTTSSGNGNSSANGESNRLDSAKSEIKGCLDRVTTGITSDVGQLDAAIQNCLGPANSPYAKLVRSQSALMLLAMHGQRSIKISVLQDADDAASQALILKHRIEKAEGKLDDVKTRVDAQASSGAPNTAYPLYRNAAVNEFGEVQLYGVMRGAISPVFWRTKETFKDYAKGATGGIGGILKTVFERKEVIAAKIGGAQRTITLGNAALIDTRCNLKEIDRAAILPDGHSDKLDCAHSNFGNPHWQRVWVENVELIKFAKDELDKLADAF